jgi:4-amino-4-deoxy-L-arabinose transferase-like glycosyltransferase
MAVGFLLRCANAGYRFLNPDEALHYLLGVQPSAAAAYRASLTTVHPPLLIVFLHYWGLLGRSELFLRLPSVLAATVFCWLMFCWLKRVLNHETALIGLALLLFSPALVLLSAEVRQYGLLLLFCSSSLYFLDLAVEENSLAAMLGSTIALYLALLTHYSSLIFALTLGTYALFRIANSRPRMEVTVIWVAGQLGALAVIAALFRSHISQLRSTNAMEGLVDTYLRRSVPRPGEHALTFIARANVRLFHYFFSQGAVGVAALGLFIIGVALLLNTRGSSFSRRPNARQLAFLFVFPLAVNCGLALFRRYPYGGTRHNAYLAIFAIPGIAVALARWHPSRTWLKPITLALVLAACNVVPSPEGEYIRLRDQDRKLMVEAAAALNSLPAGSTIFTDDQGGLLLSYYLCGSKVVQIEQQPFQPFMRSRCGDHWVISLDPDLWIFRADTFPDTLHRAQLTYDLRAGSPLWVFQSGWFLGPDLRGKLKSYGCPSPQDFGHNMFLCRVTAPPL